MRHRRYCNLQQMARQQERLVKLHRRSRKTTIISMVAVLSAITLIPFVWVLLNAFRNNAEIFGSAFALPQEWIWSNFAEAWVDGNFAGYFGNSLFSSIAA